VFLTDEDKKMLDGEYGSGTQMAMTLLKRYGEVYDAEKMVTVSRAHSHFEIPLDLLIDMTKDVNKLRSPCTLAPAFNPARYKEIGISEIKPDQRMNAMKEEPDPEVFQQRLRIFRQLGFFLTFTCAAYLIGFIPRPGQILAPVGTSGQILLNSLFGARLNPDGQSSALASAITGRTPYMGLLLPENRLAKILVQIDNLDLENLTDADYAALGYYIGGVAGSNNVVINGLSNLSLEQTRSLLSPMPVSGALALCHIVGQTYEAPTLDHALGKRKPEEIIVVGKKEIRESFEKLHTADSNNVEVVSIGCPHCTFNELGEIASILEGKKLSKNVIMIIGVSMPILTLARQMGYADIIEKAGGTFMDCCVGGSSPHISLGDIPSIAATNSPKAAHNQFRRWGGKTKILFGSAKTCIESAITGKWRG
jgi:cis-L-3-hydroxyproline dehydratase